MFLHYGFGITQPPTNLKGGIPIIDKIGLATRPQVMEKPRPRGDAGLLK